MRIRVSKGIQGQHTKKSSRIAALGIYLCDLSLSLDTKDLAYVEDSSQATSFRKGLDHYVMDCLRENIYQRVDQLLFITTHVIDYDPPWRIPSIIIVHGAYAFVKPI